MPVPLLVLALGSSLTYLNAQTGNEKSPIKISASITGDTEVDGQNLSSLILESLELELELAGFTLMDSNLPDPDIMIRGDYNIVGDTVNVILEAEISREDKSLYSVEAREELRFALDTVLLGYARDLTESIIAFVEENPDFFTSEITGEAEVEPEPMEDPSEEKDEALVEEPEAAPSFAEGQKDVSFEVQSKTKHLLFSADAGLFLATGEAGRYLKTGFAPSFFVGYSFKPGIFGGFNLGAMYFLAEGYATEAQGFIVTFGPELRMKFEESSPAVPGLRVTAGGAFFMVTPDGGETQRKLVPSGEAGMTMDFFLGKVVLTAAADIAFFYENGALLYGFIPRMGINF